MDVKENSQEEVEHFLLSVNMDEENVDKPTDINATESSLSDSAFEENNDNKLENIKDKTKDIKIISSDSESDDEAYDRKEYVKRVVGIESKSAIADVSVSKNEHMSSMRGEKISDTDNEIQDTDSDNSSETVNATKVKIGKTYLIRRPNKGKHIAQIIHSRCSEGTMEYYVHYLGLNRRLDEWVRKEMIFELKEQPKDARKQLGSEISENASADDMKQKNEEFFDRKMVRVQKRRHEEGQGPNPSIEMADLDTAAMELEKEHEALTKIKYIEHIVFGTFRINTWYYSPFPDEYEKIATIYVCQFCLKYMKQMVTYSHHVPICKQKCPPGKKVYEHENLAIYEIDGSKHQLYCQLLCLMAKLFLDHKTLYYDTDPFLFYVLCEVRGENSHIVGYFSKEKVSKTNNVACILVIPPYQRKGYGKLLIGYSYELSRRDGLIASPENPLSDLGRLSYRSFWAYTLLNIMSKCTTTKMSIADLGDISGISRDDIIYTLNSMKMIKYWIDRNTICVTRETVLEYIQLPQFREPKLLIQYNKLGWKRCDRILPIKPNKQKVVKNT